MIKHLVNYFNEGLYLSWEIKLPFRLIKGDCIHDELLDNQGKLLYPEKIPDEWISLCVGNDMFEVEDIQIDHNGVISAWLMLPKS